MPHTTFGNTPEHLQLMPCALSEWEPALLTPTDLQESLPGGAAFLLLTSSVTLNLFSKATNFCLKFGC